MSELEGVLMGAPANVPVIFCLEISHETWHSIVGRAASLVVNRLQFSSSGVSCRLCIAGQISEEGAIRAYNEICGLVKPFFPDVSNGVLTQEGDSSGWLMIVEFIAGGKAS